MTGDEMMGAATPEEFDSIFKVAYESGDADHVASLYEEDAVYVQPGLEQVIVGRAGIRQAVADTYAFLADIELTFDEPVMMRIEGDYAFCHGSSTTSFSLPDGTRHSALSRSTTVLRRGSDGLWRLILDHASGAQ